MPIIKLQGESEKRKGIYYQVNSDDQPIGVGGMGQVFKGICVDEKNGSTRPVAIKFMFNDLPPQAIERARREASIQLRNDNLVEMLGFIEIDQKSVTGEIVKHFHVVSELLDGISLSDLLEGNTKNRYGEDVPFAVKMLQDYQSDSEHFARIIVMNVLSGLMALHDAGYIHRDIDPSNIMLTADGHIKLIDFGIAKQMNTLTTSDKALTVAGKFMGKPEYAAPELALGDVQHQNQTTDIYAMGILLYQCIVGHTPFEGARHEILEKQLKAKLPLDVIKNKELRKIIATACEKKQEMRYQSSAQMRVALETMGKGGQPSSSSTKKIAIIGGSVAAAAILVVLIGVFFVVKHNRDVANEEALLAAQQAEFEAKKTDFASSVNMQVKDAMSKLDLAKSIPLDYDNFDQSYISAYEAFAKVEQMVAEDTVYHVDAPDVTAQKQEVVDSLTSAILQLAKDVVSLEGLGLTEMSEKYKNRIEKLQSFIKDANRK